MKKIPDIVIVGQATIDDIHREIEKEAFMDIPGGDSIYSAIGASMWPVNTGVVTIIGNDYPIEKLTGVACRKNRVDWSGVKVYDGPSIHDQAYYYANGRREYIFNDPELIFKLSPTANNIPEKMQKGRHVHIAPARAREQLDVLRFYKQKGAVVSLDIETHFITEDPGSIQELKTRSSFYPKH